MIGQHTTKVCKVECPDCGKELRFAVEAVTIFGGAPRN